MAPIKSNNPVASYFNFFSKSGLDAVTPEPPPPDLFEVTGGNATSTAGGNKYFYFTSPGNLSVQKISGSGDLPMSFMLVGGGGGGDDTGSGGRGAGAFVQKIDYPIAGVPGSAVNWAVTIGAGAAGDDPGSNPVGGSSTFTIPTAPKTFTATGGASGTQVGGLSSGGSGGGGGRKSPKAGGAASVPQTIDGSGNTPDTGIGYAGGNGYQNMPGPEGGTGGGGGGAGGVGGNSPSTTSNPYGIAGQGGSGRAAFLGDTNVSTAYGTSGPSAGRWFAGGGGGGNHTEHPNQGGELPVGGGGASGSPTAPPGHFYGVPVTPNTGGGGGGGGGVSNAYIGNGSAGASGICIVKIAESLLQSDTSPFQASGGTEFTYSGKKIHVFTSPGNFTVSGGPKSLEVFMVAGGGGGGGYCGGGGGSGGVVLHTDITCGNGDNAVVVGGQVARRTQGEDSTFLGMTAKGGGYGAVGGGAGGHASSGGSGGGGGSGPASTGAPGTQPSQNSPFTPDPDFAQYGNNGGLSQPGSGGNYSSNGGGGAGGAGEDNPNNGPGGYGGAGVQIPATFRDPANQYGAAGPGASFGWFAGGGGGSNSNNNGAAVDGSALGFGGNGPNWSTPYSGGGSAGQTISSGAATIDPKDGLRYTGAGGGGGLPVSGGPDPVGGRGASGIVLIAYST